ncbi:MAG: hypothetical protein D6824_10115, partial [Planctomycetota bacterium]
IGDAMLTAPGKPLDEGRLLWRISRNLELAPSSVRLAGLEAATGGIADKEDRDRRLQLVLEQLQRRFDLCLIDCPPHIGLLTFNALRAADEAVIPVETSFFSLKGAERQVRTIRSLSRRLGGQIPHRLLATMHKPTESLASELLDQLRGAFGEELLPLVVRYDPKLREAASLGRPLIEYDAASPGARDYADLAAWLLTHPLQSPAERSRRATGDELWEASLWSSPPPRRKSAAAPTANAENAAASSTDVSERAARLLEPRDLAAAQQALERRRARAASPAAGPSPAPVSRAVDLAVRARLLLARSAQLQARVQGDPNVNRVQRQQSNRAPASSGQGDAPPPLTPEAQRLCGARETSAGVLFVHPAPPHARVAVAGDFNNWSESATVLRYNPSLGVHEACVPLPPGRREYRLVVDGVWMADPHNPPPLGKGNSMVIVTKQPHAAATEGAD